MPPTQIQTPEQIPMPSPGFDLKSIVMHTFNYVTLVLANGFAIYLFVSGNHSISQVLWTYWAQSLLLGILMAVRMYMSLASDTIKPSYTAHRVWSFISNYGLFHLIYAFFLVFFTDPGLFIPKQQLAQMTDKLNLGPINIGLVLFGFSVFAAQALFNFALRVYTMKGRDRSAQAISDTAYIRIVPMHVIIIIGPILSSKFGNTGVFVAFMILKSVIDPLLLAWTERQNVDNPSY